MKIKLHLLKKITENIFTTTPDQKIYYLKLQLNQNP